MLICSRQGSGKGPRYPACYLFYIYTPYTHRQGQVYRRLTIYNKSCETSRVFAGDCQVNPGYVVFSPAIHSCITKQKPCHRFMRHYCLLWRFSRPEGYHKHPAQTGLKPAFLLDLELYGIFNSGTAFAGMQEACRLFPGYFLGMILATHVRVFIIKKS